MATYTGTTSRLATATAPSQGAMLDIALYGAASAAGGWSSQDAFPRHLADINGDGAADIVAFGFGGTYVSYSHGDIW